MREREREGEEGTERDNKGQREPLRNRQGTIKTLMFQASRVHETNKGPRRERARREQKQSNKAPTDYTKTFEY